MNIDRHSWKTHPGPLTPISDRLTDELPTGWVWTRKNDLTGLYAARDSRWEPTVPELVSTSIADVIRQAKECNAA